MKACQKCKQQREKLAEWQGQYLCLDCLRSVDTGEEAYQKLLEPDFFEQAVQEIGKRVVGETEAIKVLLLCASGRLVENSAPASFNLLVNASSGAGKDYVTGSVIKILPRSECIKRTRISPTAFTYWHNSKKEPEWTWDKKTLYLEDASNSVLNSDVTKVMCSSGSHATIVVNQQAQDLEIKGKPVLIVTSASASPNPELLRRFSILNLDESEEHTEEIKERQAEFAVNGEPEYSPLVMAALGMHERVRVQVPFAREVVQDFPSSMIVRTHLTRFYDLIKASAAFNQHKRERNEAGEVIATGLDYDLAREALIKLTSNVFMLPLTREQQEILRKFPELKEEFTEAGGAYSVSELNAHVPISEKWLRVQLDRLTTLNLLRKKLARREGSIKQVHTYSLKEGLTTLYLPTWAELSCRISSHSADNADSADNAHSTDNTDNAKQEQTAIKPHILNNKQQKVFAPIGTIGTIGIGNSGYQPRNRAVAKDGELVVSEEDVREGDE